MTLKTEVQFNRVHSKRRISKWSRFVLFLFCSFSVAIFDESDRVFTAFETFATVHLTTNAGMGRSSDHLDLSLFEGFRIFFGKNQTSFAWFVCLSSKHCFRLRRRRYYSDFKCMFFNRRAVKNNNCEHILEFTKIKRERWKKDNGKPSKSHSPQSACKCVTFEQMKRNNATFCWCCCCRRMSAHIARITKCLSSISISISCVTLYAFPSAFEVSTFHFNTFFILTALTLTLHNYYSTLLHKLLFTYIWYYLIGILCVKSSFSLLRSDAGIFFLSLLDYAISVQFTSTSSIFSISA